MNHTMPLGKKVKLTILHCADAPLPLLGLEHVGEEPPMSVTLGQCDARPTVTFPATRHHRPLAGTKLYCLVTGMIHVIYAQGVFSV